MSPKELDHNRFPVTEGHALVGGGGGLSELL